MATLSAIEFPTPDGADRALRILEDLQKQRLITVHDAAVVTWPEGKKQPKTRQAHNLAGQREGELGSNNRQRLEQIFRLGRQAIYTRGQDILHG